MSVPRLGKYILDILYAVIMALKGHVHNNKHTLRTLDMCKYPDKGTLASKKLCNIPKTNSNLITPHICLKQVNYCSTLDSFSKSGGTV